jgi:two-component system, NtrC family, sensor kinase
MRSAHQSAVRLLQLMMVASVVLPAVLFIFASWLSYRHEYAVADDRIQRSLDILHEHTLKVFQTVERAMAEVDEIVRDLPDDVIRNEQARLHLRLRHIVEALPQLRAIFLVDRTGNPLVSSQFEHVPADFNARDRDFFNRQATSQGETYVSEELNPRRNALGTPFFVLSRRRPSADGSFNGVSVVAVVPEYFEDFYALIGRNAGNVFALIRSDGKPLARFPAESKSEADATGNMRELIAQASQGSLRTLRASQADQVERRIGFRKLERFPVYVVAGIDTSAIRTEWLATMASHLIFGLPATFFLFLIIGVALQRTRRLHAEADRRETAEAALRQSQRLEAIGKLTGGVAHDFNNLLMIVSGSVQRLRRDLTAEKHLRLLDMITTATNRGESLTRQLLTFSRRQTLTPTVIDLSHRLPDLKDMLNRSLRGDIAIDVVVPQESCAVKVDSDEFELALLNLAVNARDAMPEGGSLTISAECVELAGEPAQDGLRGKFVAIRVADTGTGIAADILPHVFEPFFTTKEAGKGTGLGLSQVYGFAKQSGGVVTIESMVGSGTIITLYLPRSEELAAPPIAPAEPKSAPQRAGTVLLVEDNAQVAEVTTAYFQQLGYVVKHVGTAPEALELLGRDARIDLVFSDILMPGGMNGLTLGHAIRKRFPAIPVLLTTGYSESAHDAVAQGFTVLPKPFDLAGLEQALLAALEREQNPSQRALG